MSKQLLYPPSSPTCQPLCPLCTCPMLPMLFVCLTEPPLCLGAGDDSLIRISEDKLPGDSLALSMGKVWEVIKDQKDLNLPAHKVSLRGHLHSPLARTCACQLPGRGCEQHCVCLIPTLEAVPLQGALHEVVVLV